MLLLLFMLLGEGFSSEDVQTVKGSEGDTVHLPCMSTVPFPVDWRKQTKTAEVYVCIGDVIVPEFKPRFKLANPSPGVHNLTIFDVNLNDSGRYKCTEESGIGIAHLVDLVIKEKKKERDSTPGSTVNANVGDTVQLPCLPTVQSAVDWRKYNPFTGNDDIISTGGNVVTHLISTFQLAGYSLIISGVTPSDTGTYTCIEESGIGTEHVVSLTVTSPGPNLHVPLIVVIVVLVILCVSLIVGVAFLRRNLDRAQDAAQTDVFRIHKDDTDESLLTGSKSPQHVQLLYTKKILGVMGAATTHDKIYVATFRSTVIRVYSRSDGERFFRPITVRGMKEPYDIVASAGADPALFIADKGAHCVWRLSPKIKLASKFIRNSAVAVDNFRPRSVSIRENHLLIISSPRTLVQCNATDGTVIKCVELSGIDNVYHAVETSSDKFVVCQWKPYHAVIEVDAKGKPTSRLYRDCTPSLDHPYYLVRTKNDEIIFVDSKNDRVLMLQPDLKFKSELLTQANVGETFYPWQFCHIEDGRYILLCSFLKGLKAFRYGIVDNERSRLQSNCGPNRKSISLTYD